MNLYNGTLSRDSSEYQFYFNNCDSTEFNLLIAEYPSIPQVNEDVEEIPIDGRSGNLIIKNGTYRDREITFKLKMLDVDNLWESVEEIIDWLSYIKDNTLRFDREDYYFKVKKVEVGNIVKEIKMYGEFEVTFLCEPFLFNAPVSKKSTDKYFKIKNTGKFIVNPIIILEGKGNLRIGINGENVEIKNVKDKVIIDSNLMLCYSSIFNKLMDMNGNFPQLKVGENEILVSSNVTATTIKFEPLYR